MTTLREWLESHPVGERGKALSRAADAADVTPGAVRHWINGTRTIPAEKCAAVEAATGVRRESLRPDLFGSPSRAA